MTKTKSQQAGNITVPLVGDKGPELFLVNRAGDRQPEAITIEALAELVEQMLAEKFKISLRTALEDGGL